MKPKLIVALGFLTIFSLVNIPSVPVPARISTYSLALIPSLFASGVTYWYYESTPEVMCTVLTTSAKSVVGWHSVLSASLVFQITAGYIWQDNLGKHWKDNNDSINCALIPSFSLTPTLGIAMLELQVFRVLFEIYPYRVLALNVDNLAYPLAASVPLISFILQMIIFVYEGMLCDKRHLIYLMKKVSWEMNNENLKVLKLNLKIIISCLICMIEGYIRLRRNWSTIVNAIRSTVSCMRKRNIVAPTTIMQDSTSQQIQENQPEDKNEIGSTVLFMLVFVIVVMVGYVFQEIMNILGIVILDCLMWGLPVYWTISSDQLLAFTKQKYYQLKVKLGYF